MKKALISTAIFFAFFCVYCIKHPLLANNNDTEPAYYDRTQLDNERTPERGPYRESDMQDKGYDEPKVTAVSNPAPQQQVQTADERVEITSLNENAKPTTAYNYMADNFKTHPEESKIKSTFEGVLKKYYLQQTDEQRLKLASMLFYLRQQSKTGVTETEILKDIYDNGNPNFSVGQQAEVSFAQLEKANIKGTEKVIETR